MIWALAPEVLQSRYRGRSERHSRFYFERVRPQTWSPQASLFERARLEAAPHRACLMTRALAPRVLQSRYRGRSERHSRFYFERVRPQTWSSQASLFERARLEAAPHHAHGMTRALAAEVRHRHRTRCALMSMEILQRSRINSCGRDSAEYRSDAGDSRSHRECGDREIPSARFPYSNRVPCSPDRRIRP